MGNRGKGAAGEGSGGAVSTTCNCGRVMTAEQTCPCRAAAFVYGEERRDPRDPCTYADCSGCRTEWNVEHLNDGRCAACDATFEAGRREALEWVRDWATKTERGKVSRLALTQLLDRALVKS